jgi:hypothetical protein
MNCIVRRPQPIGRVIMGENINISTGHDTIYHLTPGHCPHIHVYRARL